MGAKITEITDEIIETGVLKAKRRRTKTFILAILAGAFIALGAHSSLLVRIGVGLGLAKFLAGIVFSTGLIMITMTGAELFTGNVLMTLSFLEKKISAAKLLKNWLVVYFGNLTGALIVVLLAFSSANQPEDYLNLAYLTAQGKISLTPLKCFISGILCNWLVCMAVYMAQYSKDTIGKVFGIVFPITIFIIAGYEHCVANMFFIPCGMLSERLLGGVFENAGTSISTVAFIKNMIPTTLGNIAGAFIFVTLPLWRVYKR